MPRPKNNTVIEDATEVLDQEKVAGAMQAMRDEGLGEIALQLQAEAQVTKRFANASSKTHLERLELQPRAAQQCMQVTKRFANASSKTHLERLDLQPRAAQQCMQVTKRFANASSKTHLEGLNLQPRAAQQCMQLTKRFANTTSKSHLEGLGKKKLLEILVLDDEQIEALTLTGQTGDLCAALRQERQERAADLPAAGDQVVVGHRQA